MIINQQHKYSIFEYAPIVEKHNYFINDIQVSQKFLRKELKVEDLTWVYKKYNVFSTLAGSYYYWSLFKELGQYVKKHLIDNLNYKILPDHIWMQAWLNWHTKDQLLKRHQHADEGKGYMHGYISIEPQDTKTVFYNNYEDKEPIYHIDNKIGNIYIGDGSKWHEVISNNSFEGDRITIGFDIMTRTSTTPNFGFIPLIY